MQIQYRLTFKDYLAAQALHAKRNGRAFFVYALSRYIYPALGICFLIFLVLTPKPLHTLFTSPGNYWGMFACAVLLSCPFFVRWSLKRCYTRTRTGPGDCTLDLAPDLIHSRMEHAKSEIEWPAIKRFAEDKNVFLLYMAQAKFLVIPKRVCGPNQIEELRALFSAQIQSA
jgi:hypothetical protein